MNPEVHALKRPGGHRVGDVAPCHGVSGGGATQNAQRLALRAASSPPWETAETVDAVIGAPSGRQRRGRNSGVILAEACASHPKAIKIAALEACIRASEAILPLTFEGLDARSASGAFHS